MTNDEMANIRRWHAVLHDENSRGNPPDVQNASDLVGTVGDLLAHIDTVVAAEHEACAEWLRVRASRETEPIRSMLLTTAEDMLGARKSAHVAP